MSKRCTQINTHRLLETAPVKIARANHVNLSVDRTCCNVYVTERTDHVDVA